MVIAGRIDPAQRGGARAKRRELRLETRGELAGEATNVIVHNISETGLLVETGQPLMVGEWFTLTLPEAGPAEAEVIWASGKLHGCRFARPVGPAALSASQLRAAVAPARADDPPAAQAAPSTGVTLGRRIAAARQAGGLTLGQLASALGVSRPTVWAWEHDRARPARHRIAALAASLGLAEAELAGLELQSDVTALVEAARVRIAAAAGTRPERVRILIEL